MATVHERAWKAEKSRPYGLVDCTANFEFIRKGGVNMTHEFLDPIFTEKQVAAWLGISPQSLQRMRLDGSGPPFVQLSQRRIGYRKSDVEHWVQQRTITRVGEPMADQHAEETAIH